MLNNDEIFLKKVIEELELICSITESIQQKKNINNKCELDELIEYTKSLNIRFKDDFRAMIKTYIENKNNIINCQNEVLKEYMKGEDIAIFKSQLETIDKLKEEIVKLKGLKQIVISKKEKKKQKRVLENKIKQPLTLSVDTENTIIEF